MQPLPLVLVVQKHTMTSSTLLRLITSHMSVPRATLLTHCMGLTGPHGLHGCRLLARAYQRGTMPYTTVAVRSSLIVRDGLLLPGFVYFSSNDEVIRTGNVGLYDVWTQPGVNPFPAYTAEWRGTLSAYYRTESIDPTQFDGDVRDLFTAMDKSYIVYYFSDNRARGVSVYTQHSTMPRDCFVVYSTDLWSSIDWHTASEFHYVGVEHDSEWL